MYSSNNQLSIDYVIIVPGLTNYLRVIIIVLKETYLVRV